MHILLVANTAWSIWQFRKNIIKSFIDKKYTVSVISPFDEYIEKLKNIGCTCYTVKISAKGANPIQDLKLTWDLIKLYKHINPDIIFHYTIKPNIYGSIAAKLANIKINIAITTGLGYTFVHKNFVSKLAKSMYMYALKYSYQVWFLNNDDRQIFIASKLVNQHKTFVLPGEGIDTKFFSPTNYNAFHESNLEINFLIIARLLWDKGYHEYVEAAKFIRQKYGKHIIFNVIGACNIENPSSIQQKILQQWIKEKHINYLGVQQDVRPYIHEANCIILPSYAEGIPLTLLEAGSMCKPLITTNARGCKDVVIDGFNGYICNIKDTTSLIKSIEKFLALDSNQKLLMGQNSRTHVVNNFAQEKVIQLYDDFIDSI
jgi:glycosyltransferase involved in cell wall biosynthesis